MQEYTRKMVLPLDRTGTNPSRFNGSAELDFEDFRLPDDDFDVASHPYDYATMEAGSRPSEAYPGNAPVAEVSNERSLSPQVSDSVSKIHGERMSFALPLEVLVGNQAFSNGSRSEFEPPPSNPYWVSRLSDLFDHFGFWIGALLAFEAWNSLKIAGILDEYLRGGVWVLAGSAFAMFWVINSVLWFRFRNSLSSRFLLPGGILLVSLFVLAAALHFHQAIPVAD